MLFRVDNGYRSRVLFGNWVYDYPEQSADIPGELHQLGEIGWIPVDFTPGFYYNTYALLRMAELARGIVLAFLFALEVLFAVLELFRWRFEQKIRGPMKHWKNMFMEAQR